MINHVGEPKRGNCLEPTDITLLGNPLDFFYEDHLREREICATLDKIAASESPNAEDLFRALSFLREELPLHREDEEQDLFPLLRRRCELEDEIDKAIARLSADHLHSEEDAPVVADILAGLETGQESLSDDERTTLTRYAAHVRRHLILENAIILPFAKLRLTKRDLATLTLRMMQRRGLDRLTETAEAE